MDDAEREEYYLRIYHDGGCITEIWHMTNAFQAVARANFLMTNPSVTRVVAQRFRDGFTVLDIDKDEMHEIENQFGIGRSPFDEIQGKTQTQTQEHCQKVGKKYRRIDLD